jgi:pyridoxamine 5'-phosphate oxidase
MNQSPTSELRDMRVSYELDELAESQAPASPFELFQSWLGDAVAHQLPEPNAMSLATIGSDGGPTVRTVLLKGLDDRGFTFFTNYDSRKGHEMAADARVALTFCWAPRQRQVCVRGLVIKLPRAEAESYFAVRPYGNQIGAWASTQSIVIPDRLWLEQRAEELRQRYPEGAAVPCPEFWGGYAVVPNEIEFWQGRRSRLHDRLRYRLQNDTWHIDRLSP